MQLSGALTRRSGICLYALFKIELIWVRQNTMAISKKMNSMVSSVFFYFKFFTNLLYIPILQEPENSNLIEHKLNIKT